MNKEGRQFDNLPWEGQALSHHVGNCILPNDRGYRKPNPGKGFKVGTCDVTGVSAVQGRRLSFTIPTKIK